MLNLRGLPYRVTTWGDPASSPVFLLHGWGDSSDTFQFLVDSSTADRHWIALDWRGFGDTPGAGPTYWFPDYFADLDALLELYTPEQPAVVIAHSMGGNVASMYAGIRPHRIARLINLEGIGLPRTQPEDAPDRYGRWLEALRSEPTFSVYRSIEEFAALLHRRNPAMPMANARFVAKYWLKPCAEGYTLRWDPAHKRVNPVLFSREGLEACWRASTAPTLLVLGGRSDLRLALGLDGDPSSFEGVYPQIRVHVLPQAGHLMHIEEPDTLAALIDAFMDERR